MLFSICTMFFVKLQESELELNYGIKERTDKILNLDFFVSWNTGFGIRPVCLMDLRIEILVFPFGLAKFVHLIV